MAAGFGEGGGEGGEVGGGGGYVGDAAEEALMCLAFGLLKEGNWGS